VKFSDGRFFPVTGKWRILITLKNVLECMALNERGVNCLKGVFTNFLSYNEILYKKPD